MKLVVYLWALVAVALLASPAAATSLSLSQFWAGFRNYWGEIFGSFGGVVGLVLGAGAVGIFIITRGKWLK